MNAATTCVRTGRLEQCLALGSWDGYPGGDAPGMAFETLAWVARTELAALATDTWGAEVRPNETEPGINQPWHWITIPMMGMTMGESSTSRSWPRTTPPTASTYLFVAPAAVTGAVGSARQSAWRSSEGQTPRAYLRAEAQNEVLTPLPKYHANDRTDPGGPAQPLQRHACLHDPAVLRPPSPRSSGATSIKRIPIPRRSSARTWLTASARLPAGRASAWRR